MSHVLRGRGHGGYTKTRPDLRGLELSLMRARATPAPSELVAIQVRQDMASLADSPALDELPDALSPEGR